MTQIKISDLGNLTAFTDTTYFPVVNTAATFTTVKSTGLTLKSYVLDGFTGNVANLGANTSTLQGNITSLESRATALESNVSSLQSDVTSLFANAAVQAGELATLTANAGIQSGSLGTLTANAGIQAGELATLTANASVQAGELATLTSNAAVQAGAIADLLSNASVQTGELETLTANAAVQAGELSDLIANAAAQSGDIGAISANLAIAESDIEVLQGLVGNLQSDGGNIISNVTAITDGTATFANIVPSADSTYDLGSDANRFKDLYLSESTIYLGSNVSLSANAGALITSGNITATNVNVTGTQISFGQGAYIDETEIAGLPGYYGLALNSSDDGVVGINAVDGDANIATSVIASNTAVQINTNDSSNVEISHGWTFQGISGAGVLMFPDFTQQSTAYTATFTNVAPSGPSDTGVKGDIRYDASYIYICVDTDTWIRAGREAW